jgi:hypothetical protein
METTEARIFKFLQSPMLLILMNTSCGARQAASRCGVLDAWDISEKGNQFSGSRRAPGEHPSDWPRPTVGLLQSPRANRVSCLRHSKEPRILGNDEGGAKTTLASLRHDRVRCQSILWVLDFLLRTPIGILEINVGR